MERLPMSPDDDGSQPPHGKKEAVLQERPSTPEPQTSILRGSDTSIGSTPSTRKLAGTLPHSSKQLSREERRIELGREIKQKFVGPMPWNDFLEEYLPDVTGQSDSRRRSVNFKPIAAVTGEGAKGRKFISIVKSKFPELVFMDSSEYKDEKCDLKPDVSAYSPNSQPPTDKPTDFSKMEFWMEFKTSPHEDAFNYYEGTASANSSRTSSLDDLPNAAGHTHRAQLADYAAASLGLQFRNHILSVFICGDFARLLRWDRAGAVVTERIDYTKNSSVLVDFLQRFARATPEVRGFDASVSAATERESKGARAAFGEHVSKPTPLLKVKIPGSSRKAPTGDAEMNEDATPSGYYIIPAPTTLTNRSPFGRATRGSVAFNMDTKQLVYYKDYWRPDDDAGAILQEGKIYELLEKAEVKHIAPYERGGDVENNVTRTHEVKREDWALETTEILRYKNYRIALGVVGEPLNKFKSSRELCQVIADAMEAHDEAYAKAKVLHRDISVGNIIIRRKLDGTVEGLLIDWDLCAMVPPDSPRRAGRTGTWQFISCNILENPGAMHEIEDDRESALHLLTWLLLRHGTHNYTLKQVSDRLAAYDEATPTLVGPTEGGTKKVNFLLKKKQLPDDLVLTGLQHLKSFLNDLADVFAVRYRPRPTKAEDSEFEKMELQMEAAGRRGQEVPEYANHFYKAHPCYKLREHTALLKQPGWLVAQLRNHIDKEIWPANDAAVPFTPLSANESSRKRKDASESTRSSKKKNRKLGDGSGSRRTSEGDGV